MDHLNIGGNIGFLENDSKSEIIKKLKPILSDKLILNQMQQLIIRNMKISCIAILQKNHLIYKFFN